MNLHPKTADYVINTAATLKDQRDELLEALREIVATDFLMNGSGVRETVLARWQRALEIAYSAIDKAEGK